MSVTHLRFGNSQVILLGLALELPASFTLFFFKDEHALGEESDALHTQVYMLGLDPCIILDAHWDARWLAQVV
jgi:hypothetical protein